MPEEENETTENETENTETTVTATAGAPQTKIRLPRRNEGEMFALATQLMGATQIKALCEDGKERMCRIPGKLRKRVWIRQNDVLIIRLWEWQKDRADIVWRIWGTQTEQLKKRGLLKNLPV